MFFVRRAHPYTGRLTANEYDWQSHIVCAGDAMCLSVQRSTGGLCCALSCSRACPSQRAVLLWTLQHVVAVVFSLAYRARPRCA